MVRCPPEREAVGERLNGLLGALVGSCHRPEEPCQARDVVGAGLADLHEASLARASARPSSLRFSASRLLGFSPPPRLHSSGPSLLHSSAPSLLHSSTPPQAPFLKDLVLSNVCSIGENGRMASFNTPLAEATHALEAIRFEGLADVPDGELLALIGASALHERLARAH